MILVLNLVFKFELKFKRHCTSGAVYESTKITNKLLDANTLYQLDKYSKYYSLSKTNIASDTNNANLTESVTN